MLLSLLVIPVVITVTIVFAIGNSIGSSSIFLFPLFEIVWLVLPVTLFLCFGISSLVLSYSTLSHGDEFTLALESSQWMWNGGIISAALAEHLLWFVRCGLIGSSCDVIHSFSLMDLGIHTDCIPGNFTTHYFNNMVVSSSFITCQELCGYGHSSITLGIEW